MRNTIRYGELSLFLLLFLLLPVRGQEEFNRKGSWYLLPEVGLQLGNYNCLDITAVGAYNLTDWFSVGIGPHLCFYYQVSSALNPEQFFTFIYGAKAISRISVIKNAERFVPFGLISEIFLHGEYEALNLEREYFDNPTYPDEGRFWLHSVYAGAGITQEIGPRTSVYYMLLWDISENSISIYSNPQYRIGLNIYL